MSYIRLVKDIFKGKPAKLRSPEWPKVEHAHLTIEPLCQWCGANRKLQVHHIAPFHIHPELELDPQNLITLCEEGGDLNCHYIHGHDKDWKSFNPSVRTDCDRHKDMRAKMCLSQCGCGSAVGDDDPGEQTLHNKGEANASTNL